MKKIIALTVLGLCLAVNVAEAKKKNTEHKTYEQKTYVKREIVDPRTTEDKEPWLKYRFEIPEKGILLRYSDEIIGLPRAQQKSLPPGLAKKVARGKRLPPGWQRKLARGRTCPADVYSHTIKLPDHILYQLPPQPEGTVLVALEGKVVRLAEATKTIIDIFDLKW